MNIRNLIKANIISALCLLAFISLFFPIATITASMEMFGSSSSSEQTISGFTAVKEGVFGYLLIAGPALLVACNYVKQLFKYRKLFAVLIPCLCLLTLIIVMFQAKGVALVAMGYNESAYFDVKVKFGPAIGFFIAAATYIAMGVIGLNTHYNVTLDKDGLAKLKADSFELMESTHEKVTQTVHSVSAGIASAKNASENISSATSISAATSKPQSKKPININKTEEILAVVEKLAKLKEDGVLTEEEFNEKKRQLLEEI